MKKTLLLTALNLTFFLSYSQVGIGNINPNTNSILDLTNSNSKGLLLPKSPSTVPNSPAGLLFFNESDSVLYYNEGGAYNGLSPWRYKFGSTPTSAISSVHTYFIKSGGNVGIGLSSPQYKLHVKDDGEVLRIEGDNSSFLSFYPSGFGTDRGNIGFISTSTPTLTIANGFNNNDINITTLGAGDVNITNGDVDIQDGKIKEYGNDLLPRGSIIMWSGDTIPDGWALCDGQSHLLANGSGTSVTVPDLKGRFIVGHDPANSTYAMRLTGGADSVTLIASECALPNHHHPINHGHAINDPGHSHHIDLDDVAGSGGIDDAGSSTETNKEQTLKLQVLLLLIILEILMIQPYR